MLVPDRRSQVVVDERPWGSFRRYCLNESATVKLLTVAAGQALSLQRHECRDELWVIVDAGLEVRVGDQSAVAVAGDEFFIARGTLHRVGGGAFGGRFFEVAFGAFDEHDIQRLDDRYGRP